MTNVKYFLNELYKLPKTLQINSGGFHGKLASANRLFSLSLTWNTIKQLELFAHRNILPIPIMDRPRKHKRLFFILMKMVEICCSPHTEAKGIPTWSCLATKNSEQWQPTKALYWRAWRGIEVVGLITISSPSSSTSVFLILSYVSCETVFFISHLCHVAYWSITTLECLFNFIIIFVF